MARPRRNSDNSIPSTAQRSHRELGTMYDYLAKIILIGPSGSGKSCLLHRIVKSEWRVLSSQTIGVEFASRIIKVGNGSRRKRIKLQLWDTAGTERFRSVSRSYYRGAAGALLVYDVASHDSFAALQTFLDDARALASPNLTALLTGNKADLVKESGTLPNGIANTQQPMSPSGVSTPQTGDSPDGKRMSTLRSLQPITVAPEGREVTLEEASQWASKSGILVSTEVSAFTGDGVEEVFTRLAAMILTKIELGEIDPDDPNSGIQYGDNTGWEDAGSIHSAEGLEETATGPADTTATAASGAVGTSESTIRKRKPWQNKKGGSGTWGSGLRDWENVFKTDGRSRKRGGGCC